MAEPIWAEINLANIRHNIREVRRLVGAEREIMAVVKANGYGHGAVQVAKAVLAAGANRLAVARLCEALTLREAGITAPILIFGYLSKEQMAQALQQQLTITVYRLDMAEQLAELAQEAGKSVRIHLKVDTGMGRLGFCEGEQGIREIEQICSLPGLICEGIYTHFATADEKDKTYTKWQLDRFLSLLHVLEQRGITFPLRHAANSAAIIDFPAAYLDMVRPGIMIYGLYPSAEVEQHKVKLLPAMSLKARITHLKKVTSGTKISYGCTYVTPEDTVIASLPLGYADGYPRLLSSRGQVLIKGQRAPVVGRVCMDQCMVDVGKIPDVKVHDEVIIFGQGDQQSLPVEEVADWSGTINYEVVCWIGSRVPRFYID